MKVRVATSLFVLLVVELGDCGTYDVNEAVEQLYHHKSLASNKTLVGLDRPGRTDRRLFTTSAMRRDSLASDSGYGGGGGYGGYDCNSALGLFGLLGLLSALRNIINQLTQATTGRRKRSVEEARISLLTEMMGGLGEDVVDVMAKDLPLIIIPLVAQFAEISDFDHPSDCVLRSVCLANRHIVGTYGGIGRAVANMVTSTITSQFVSCSKQSSDIVVAAKRGRKMEDCASVYPKCSTLLNADLSAFFEIEQDVNDIDNFAV